MAGLSVFHEAVKLGKLMQKPFDSDVVRLHIPLDDKRSTTGPPDVDEFAAIMNRYGPLFAVVLDSDALTALIFDFLVGNPGDALAIWGVFDRQICFDGV